MGVALRGTRWASCHTSGVGDLCSSLTVGGADDDLLIVMCSQPWLSQVAVVESLDGESCIAEVFGGIPDFVFFWSVSFPLSLILELVVVESRVDDFVEFEFLFSFYLDKRRGFLDL